MGRVHRQIHFETFSFWVKPDFSRFWVQVQPFTRVDLLAASEARDLQADVAAA